MTGFPGLRPMTTPLKVTQYVPPLIVDQSPYNAECKSEGNLVNGLDSARPTALLISAIEKNPLACHVAKRKASTRSFCVTASTSSYTQGYTISMLSGSRVG